VVRIAKPRTGEKEALVYLFCDSCGVVYLQQHTDAPQELDGLYDLHYRKDSSDEYLKFTRFKSEINAYRYKWLQSQLRDLNWEAAAHAALDIGSKDGSFLRLLQDGGWTVVGVDPNARYADLAAEHYGVRILPRLFGRGLFSPGSFDLVTLFHVIEHVERPQALLAEIREVLVGTGMLYIETPNAYNIHRRQLAKEHVMLFSPHTLTQLMEQVGFRVLRISEYGPGMMTFDQLAVLAQPGEQRGLVRSKGDQLKEIKASFEQALKSNFPSPGRLALSNYLFRFAQRVLGDSLATQAKNLFLSIRSWGRRRIPEKTSSESGPMQQAGCAGLVREAFLSGRITERQFREIGRLKEEPAQLKVLARIKVMRLSLEEISRMVDGELARARR